MRSATPATPRATAISDALAHDVGERLAYTTGTSWSRSAGYVRLTMSGLAPRVASPGAAADTDTAAATTALGCAPSPHARARMTPDRRSTTSPDATSASASGATAALPAADAASHVGGGPSASAVKTTCCRPGAPTATVTVSASAPLSGAMVGGGNAHGTSAAASCSVVRGTMPVTTHSPTPPLQRIDGTSETRPPPHAREHVVPWAMEGDSGSEQPAMTGVAIACDAAIPSSVAAGSAHGRHAWLLHGAASSSTCCPQRPAGRGTAMPRRRVFSPAPHSTEHADHSLHGENKQSRCSTTPSTPPTAPPLTAPRLVAGTM
mmetsp:Transcript_28038/g.96975  ORF Transcript_28038/g.96975 Transcript_28038/m.96975 type:complete len:320 (-) Transcript_28038:1686-2645(-)